ncbi:hypothetical protein [Aquisediminimonas sediminicola]|uniref:hypothetical protein n=1 Tax=Alteraquisediminimonas sediminicola TaxID=2676787 RepID=UPI001FE3BC07|nr:hypothetical protein [Aquisediminimonas sediminicola]
MAEPTTPEPLATNDQTEGDSVATGAAPLGIKDIALRLQSSPNNLAINPVSRARMWVEMEIPENQRGPGWDRHWRELEAYADSTGTWSNKEE